jgi:hypothetical protein
VVQHGVPDGTGTLQARMPGVPADDHQAGTGAQPGQGPRRVAVDEILSGPVSWAGTPWRVGDPQFSCG